MHEFYLAQKIVRAVKNLAQKHNLKRVKEITLQLGQISEQGEKIQPANLIYNINLMMPMKVKIKRIKGKKLKIVNLSGER